MGTTSKFRKEESGSQLAAWPNTYFHSLHHRPPFERFRRIRRPHFPHSEPTESSATQKQPTSHGPALQRSPPRIASRLFARPLGVESRLVSRAHHHDESPVVAQPSSRRAPPSSIMASAIPTPNKASPQNQAAPPGATPASPPNKRDLKSWWKGFKLPSKHHESAGTDPRARSSSHPLPGLRSPHRDRQSEAFASPSGEDSSVADAITHQSSSQPRQ